MNASDPKDGEDSRPTVRQLKVLRLFESVSYGTVEVIIENGIIVLARVTRRVKVDDS